MTALMQFDKARIALEKAHKIDEVKQIRDQAAAIERYAKQQKECFQMQQQAAEIKIRAERQAGKLLAEIPRTTGNQYTKQNESASSIVDEAHEEKTYTEILEENQIPRPTAARWQLIAEEFDDHEFDTYLAQTKATQKELTSADLHKTASRKRQARQHEEQREENQTLVAQSQTEITKISEITQTFSTLVLDPPWDWEDEGDVNQFGRAKPTYATLSFDEILLLPLESLAEKNAHCYLWITNRSLPKGFLLLEKWGFRYVTCLTWCKPSFGMGNYFRGSTEHLLFGVKGSLPLTRHDVGTWFSAPRGDHHSEKPCEAYTMIESCSPPAYLELFARTPRQGWFTWGGEL